MSNLHYLLCKFLLGHDWHNDDGYPVHGYNSIPYPDSYCLRCHINGDGTL